MWSDNETSEDLLGFKVHADLLLDVINDDSVLPVTIGVFGDWGSGKSSILRIMQQSLEDTSGGLKNDTLVLYFNGWVFEGYDDAKAALLESIIEGFQKNSSIKDKVVTETMHLLKSVNWMRVMGFALKKIAIPATTAYLTGGLSIIPFLANELKNFTPEKITENLKGDKGEEFLKGILKERDLDENKLVRELRGDFKKMIDSSKIKKLVVIIDDLDRCTPDRIIENLEAIKLFLNVEKTAFIIGADPRIVRHAIEHRYKTDGIETANDLNNRNKRIVSDYLEKLIQIPYILPRLSDHEVETYITLLFCKKEINNSFSKVLDTFAAQRQNNRYGAFGFGDIEKIISREEKDKLGESVSLIAALSPIITEGLNGNPRQIKRFLNTFTLRNRLVKIAQLADFKTEILIKLMVLEYSNPELFRKIYDWQSIQKGEPKELIEIETLILDPDKEKLKNSSYRDWGSESTINWLKMEPKLSGVDLRDYFWISRDQLNSSIHGSSLIPTHIRKLYLELLSSGSGTILEKIINEQVLSLTELGNEQLLSLLEKDIIKAPENSEIHKVFIAFVKNKIPNSKIIYINLIKMIDNSKIPFFLSNDLQLGKNKNQDLIEVMKAFDPQSQVGKAIKKRYLGGNK